MIFSFILSPPTQEDNKDTTYLSPLTSHLSFEDQPVTSRSGSNRNLSPGILGEEGRGSEGDTFLNFD